MIISARRPNEPSASKYQAALEAGPCVAESGYAPVCGGRDGLMKSAATGAKPPGVSVIAIGGGVGTLAEIGLALKMGNRVVHIGSWELDPERLQRFADASPEYLQAISAEVAVVRATSVKSAPPSGHG